MRGSPPLHLLILALLLGLIAIPLTHLTLAGPASIAGDSPATQVKSGPKLVKTLVRVRFAHVPVSLSLKLGQQELLPSAIPAASLVEAEAQFPITGDGIELALSAKWPDGTHDTALTVELQPDGLDTRSETRWSDGSTLDEILDFKW